MNRLQRINQTLELMTEQQRQESRLKPIASLVVRPSRDLREITHQHMAEIPPAVRTLLRALGGWGRDWRMASYLLFESVYCQELMHIGYQDGLRQKDEIREFLEVSGEAA
jgi:NTE family protein